MAAPGQRGRPNRTQANINKAKIKPGSIAAQGRDLLKQSYGGDATSTNTGGGAGSVMDYYKSLSLKDRKAAFRDLYNRTQASQATWTAGGSGKISGVLFGDLAQGAKQAYSAARGGTVTGGGAAAPTPGGGFAVGVSATTGKFITEAGQSRYASGEAETNTTRRGGKGKGGKKRATGTPKTRAAARGKAGTRQKYNVDKGFHISKSGAVVKNVGGQKTRSKKSSPRTGPRVGR